ncbi:hypothetical protein BJ508DRAFT_306931 [Ascobolus immersus RN42]|uniref:Uncharacterized protein n=1 Tax=Ascobolus immersus RN42 TaxID=1160509 RepID=A0A3N4I4F3_ASCIM|nr:hypothetical protein BJ508DRAFT_306931 [Ascobolus immersus RN42]
MSMFTNFQNGFTEFMDQRPDYIVPLLLGLPQPAICLLTAIFLFPFLFLGVLVAAYSLTTKRVVVVGLVLSQFAIWRLTNHASDVTAVGSTTQESIKRGGFEQTMTMPIASRPLSDIDALNENIEKALIVVGLPMTLLCTYLVLRYGYNPWRRQ